VRVAAAQAASVWLDPAATADKVLALIENASREGVELLAFPETFLSGYPFWVMLGGGGRFGDAEQARGYGAYLEAAVELDGPELRRVTEARAIYARSCSSERRSGVAEPSTARWWRYTPSRDCRPPP
jgi:nitrilase